MTGTETGVTSIQIDDDGPWTVAPSPRREVDLQTRQTRLHADLSRLVDQYDGDVFATRFDNVIAVTNGLDLAGHRRIQDAVRIAHFDVNDATDRYTDGLDAFEVFRRIDRGNTALLEYMFDAHDSLSFFIGGDNAISVTSGLDETAFDEAIGHVTEATGTDLKVGVRRDRTAGRAGMAAKEVPERCREDGTRVEIAPDETARGRDS
ncbi:GTP cyclohydrolase IIa [Natrinema caseinilyticum]|uniref:GTP cyclohydrolase IIa n=1 Tax=Natrinema caseinilyticum TaxID=2961570 RepID=UPI0020C34128|nr:GTP cyclohydrolase IIa [Natrinema caseinilyticum]